MTQHGAWRRALRRVPLLHQLTSTECAAACLGMVAGYYGRDTTVAECRQLLGGGRDGVSASRLTAAAADLGLIPGDDGNDGGNGNQPAPPRPGAHRVEKCGRAGKPNRPASGPTIAFLADHHFVVVEKIGRRGVRLADPAAGRLWQPRSDFLARYGGLLIDLVPGPAFTPRRRRIREQLLLRYLHQFVAAPGGRRILAGILLLAGVLKVLGLALPLATQSVVDTLVPDSRSDLLPQLAVAIVGTAVLVGVVSLIRALALVTLRARADTLLGRRFVRHLLRLPLPYFLQRSRGDLLMRLESVSSTRELVTQQLLTLVLDAALLVGYLVGLAVVAPGYLPVVAVLIAAQFFILLPAYPRLGALSQTELADKTEEQNYLVETLQAIGTVKANGVEPRVQAHWEELFGRYRRSMTRRSRMTAKVESAHHGLAALAPLALLWLGMALVLDGRMTLGAALAANAVALSVLTPVHTLAALGQIYPMLRSQIERMFDVLDATEEHAGTQTLPADQPATVELSNVVYRYQPGAEPVLHDVSIQVPAGSKVAIVGRTGSGKSTIALLVLGLLRPDTGSIRHNGIDLADLDLHALRAGFGVVLQDLNLFNGTLWANLRLGSPNATDADVITATEIAGLHTDIGHLPMGYDTLVGEGGATLSAGQRQRVALARALVNKPRLLILDEATSHLDPETERRVDAALSRLDVTRIVISHRVNAIRNADQIMVLDRGRIVARGQHHDLIKEGGTYQELFADASHDAAASIAAPPVDGQTPSRLEALIA